MASRFAMSPGFSGALYSAYNPGSMIDGAQKGRSLQNQAIATTEADEANAIRLGEARVAMAKSGAGAIEAQGSAQGQMSMMSGLTSGLTGLAGGLASRGGGGAPIGVDRTSPGMGIPGSVAPVTKLPYYGPSF